MSPAGNTFHDLLVGVHAISNSKLQKHYRSPFRLASFPASLSYSALPKDLEVAEGLFDITRASKLSVIGSPVEWKHESCTIQAAAADVSHLHA
jgi:hypothetical protein